MRLPYKKNLVNFMAPFRSQVVARAGKLHEPRLCDIELKFLYFFRVATANFLNLNLFFNFFRKLLRYCFNPSEISSDSGVYWAPLAKIATTPTSSVSPSVLTSSYLVDGSDKINSHSNYLELSGKSILCVGGFARLYPEYSRLVEAAGGRLWIYRGNQKEHSEHLPVLLTHADMVLCPIDCINHEAYFTVKKYCKESGKPCVLLQHSNFATFLKGIETLAGIYFQSTK